MKFPILKSGLFRWSNKKEANTKGELSLIKWLKSGLSYLNVTYSDVCCDVDANAPTPSRYNPASGVIEYFDAVANDWTSIPSLCFAWSIYNDSGSSATINYVDCNGDAQTATVADNANTSVAGHSITAPNITNVYITFLGLD